MEPDLDDALLALFEEEAARRAAPPSLRAWIERTSPQHCPIPWHLGQLIDLFARAIESPTLALVSMPPRHAKTTTVRRALAYTILTAPERLNAFVTYAADYAYTHSRAIRKLVQQHGGRIADDAANVKDWRTPEEGGLSATGIGGQLTGKGFGGLLVVDDPFKNREEAESTVVREKVWNGFNDDIYTRREPTGSIVVVATRWHEDDLNGRLERETDDAGQPTWEVINLPAIRDPDTGEAADTGVALWPERYPPRRPRPHPTEDRPLRLVVALPGEAAAEGREGVQGAGAVDDAAGGRSPRAGGRPRGLGLDARQPHGGRRAVVHRDGLDAAGVAGGARSLPARAAAGRGAPPGLPAAVGRDAPHRGLARRRGAGEGAHRHRRRAVGDPRARHRRQVHPRALALFFGIENVFISKMLVDDESGTGRRVWGDTDLWMGHVNPARDELTAVRRFRAAIGGTNQGVAVRTAFEADGPLGRDDIYVTRMDSAPYVVGADFAGVIRNVRRVS